ncbi:hypothetical protein EAI30_14500 [Romboutsia ilealis]|uniref:Uncharacterized protein n=1 Tax=Romboutsia faecis TaxID=2764597 RepID=A0ABR7JTH1_9FIRM|nr:hypothetical protein [Romboutsia faecis]MBC5998207.1 hypothetical protein [Romboutsia faecis]MRN25827.1 hypothetical protein [Romboutsia ilealis]
MANKMIEFLIESGAELTGSSVGAIIGGSVAGPGGAVAGIVGGKAVEMAFSKLGSEIQSRVLSKRENKKIGATATYALSKIKENIEKGKQLRDDDFFEEDFTGRSKADEIMEGVMFSAQREHEENKLKYYGNLVANIAFDKTVSREQANQLISIAQKLSYRQIKLLNLYAINQQIPKILLKNEDYSKNGISGYKLISILQDTLELYHIGIVGGSGSVILEMAYINPSEIKVQGMGALLYNLMELSAMPYTELEELISMLR